MNIDFKVCKELLNKGFSPAEIQTAFDAAQKNGESSLNGWTIRKNSDGEWILLHPSWCGIYIGDYESHVIFQKNISCRSGRYGYAPAKYSELPAVLGRCSGNILCECHADQYDRRKKQVEKLGYRVLKSNISACESSISTCVFVIEK